jgi:hypothetical protein
MSVTVTRYYECLAAWDEHQCDHPRHTRSDRAGGVPGGEAIRADHHRTSKAGGRHSRHHCDPDAPAEFMEGRDDA